MQSIIGTSPPKMVIQGKKWYFNLRNWWYNGGMLVV
jgi:hypothetical protein